MDTSTPLPDLNAASSAAQVMAHDLSLWGLFMSADLVVKLVIIGLLAASFWSWTIIFNKFIRLKNLFIVAKKFEDSFWSGGSLEKLYERVSTRSSDPMSAIFAAAMREWQKVSDSPKSTVSGPERIERAMQVTLTREMDKLENNMGFLASVSSTAPFIGLFGTVWGIMNSFQSIAASQNTSLAVVAPGIAEALFATALGLVAAIPAAIAYNKFSMQLNSYANRLDSFVSEFGAVVHRQIEEGR